MHTEITELFERDESILNRKREEFRVCLIESIEEVLSFSRVVLNFLELNSDFREQSILESPKNFSCGLEDLFGDSARGIEDLIVERLYKKINKKYVRDRDKKFEDHIKDGLKGYIEYY